MSQYLDWFDYEDLDLEAEDISFTEYDISAAPNDFNVKTLYDFIGSGVVKIPGFQRNYVWDIKRASKLIESILIGIPIPQIFLYEEAKNKFTVIDGQQRYMTIYYFLKQRFPRLEKRQELRLIFDQNKGIPDNIISNDEYFTNFNLKLPTSQPNQINKFNGLNYKTLDEEDRVSFDLRTIRNIIIKQNTADDDHSVVFEIFNRLNSGGVNLKPQEIRTSLFHSDFYDMLYRLNLNSEWRKLTPSSSPDLNMKDVEILLRGFAMLVDGPNYKPSMTKFLNHFSANAKRFTPEIISYFESLFVNFAKACNEAGEKIFHSKTGRFNISFFESIFVGVCHSVVKNKSVEIKPIDNNKIDALRADENFIAASQSDTASGPNVKYRLEKAMEILG